VASPKQMTLFPDPDPAAVGLTCPGCGAIGATSTLQTLRGGMKVIRLNCAACNRFLRHVDVQGRNFRYEPAPPDAAKPDVAPPPASWQWLGFIRQADRVWKAVALTDSLASCWDALLTYPGAGDLLCIPGRPRRLGEEGDIDCGT
jgi:hypothetical protein